MSKLILTKGMKEAVIETLLGLGLIVVGFILGWVWFGLKLVVVILLLILGIAVLAID